MPLRPDPRAMSPSTVVHPSRTTSWSDGYGTRLSSADQLVEFVLLRLLFGIPTAQPVRFVYNQIKLNQHLEVLITYYSELLRAALVGVLQSGCCVILVRLSGTGRGLQCDQGKYSFVLDRYSTYKYPCTLINSRVASY